MAEGNRGTPRRWLARLETTVAPNALFDEEYAEHVTSVWHLSDGPPGRPVAGRLAWSPMERTSSATWRPAAARRRGLRPGAGPGSAPASTSGRGPAQLRGK